MARKWTSATTVLRFAKAATVNRRAMLTPFLVDFPKTIEGLRPTLKLAKDHGAPFVVVMVRSCP